MSFSRMLVQPPSKAAYLMSLAEVFPTKIPMDSSSSSSSATTAMPDRRDLLKRRKASAAEADWPMEMTDLR
eukprot:scaffold29670_cov55-Attheya_sp.AAC.12